MCAGPSLPAHLEKLPTGCALFGINHHASRLVDCDYIVFNDEHTWELVKDLPGKKISQFAGKNDILVEGHKNALSAIVAMREARDMGFDEIYIAGADCSDAGFYPQYVGGKHPRTERAHLKHWMFEDFTNVWVMGGPLQRFAPLYGG